MSTSTSEHATTGQTAEHATTRGGIVRAVLAGGLVLGVGAAVTLAAWNDSEFATGTFGAGSFNLEGQETAGGGFADHETAPGAALTFVVEPLNLAPADVVYAPFAVRLDAATTTDAVVTLSSVGAGANAANLTYEILTTDAFGCDAGTTGGELVAAGTATTSTDIATFDLTQGAAAAAGDPVNLCLIVTAGAGLIEGGAATVTWEFAAESVSDND
jgi:predicted ribosomally synthesized peptide with SipW-like signal peptide